MPLGPGWLGRLLGELAKDFHAWKEGQHGVLRLREVGLRGSLRSEITGKARRSPA